jgi:hypothetical protein
VSPDDLATVRCSWAALAPAGPQLVEVLSDILANDVDVVDEAQPRARRLVDAVAELVDLLATPSSLGQRARQLAESWPNGSPSPSFRVDGQAWIAAATFCDPCWTACTEQAWRQAWLLLAEELAEDSLSPFSVPTYTLVRDLRSEHGCAPVARSAHCRARSRATGWDMR